MDYRSKKYSICRQLNRVKKQMKVTRQALSVKTGVSDHFLSHNKFFRLHLDDAVIVLRNLTQTSTIDSPQFSMNAFQAMVDRKVISFLTSQTNTPITPAAPVLSRLSGLNPSKSSGGPPYQRGPKKGNGALFAIGRRGHGMELRATALHVTTAARPVTIVAKRVCREPSAFTRKKKLRQSENTSNCLPLGSNGPGFFGKAPR